MEDDVKPSFAKFDKDGSGAIDREELTQLMKELGQEMTEEMVTTALKDLDINEDGVIDLDEFSRWYFTGMRPYNGARRSMLKFAGKSLKLVDALKE
jgi:Ca2+-binding EF-hand superfamily protein